MSVLLLLGALGLLALPSIAAPLGQRLPPAEWARIAGAAAWLGLVGLRVGLFFTAAPTVLRSVGVHDVADACHRLMGPPAASGPALGWLAAAAFVAVTVNVARVQRAARRAQRAMRVEPWLGAHEELDGAALVVLPTSQPLAYAVGGRSPQVVLSQGIVDVLSPAELAAVVRHELAHLQHRHDRYLVLGAGVVAAGFGGRAAQRVRSTLELAVERWADESAADAGGRGAVRSALSKCVALPDSLVPAFTTRCTVEERLDALRDSCPQGRWEVRLAVLMPTLILSSFVVGFVAWAAAGHHGLLGLVGFCPL